MIRVHVHGAGGRMGSASTTAINATSDMTVTGTSGRDDELGDALDASRPDVLVEFTVPSAVEAHLRTAVAHGIPVVSGTTGLSDTAQTEIDAIARERGVVIPMLDER